MGGLSIWQDQREFCFGVDAVLLSSFADVKKGDLVLDLCTGNGIVPLLLSKKKEPKEIYGIEINPRQVSLAKRSVADNHLGHIQIIEGDIKDASALLPLQRFHHITCNPPYMKDGGLQNPNRNKAIARHEILCNIDDVVRTAASLLHFGGKLSLVHRPERMIDVLETMRAHKIEPKRLMSVHAKQNADACLFLVEGTLGGGKYMHIMPPLILYGEDGAYTENALAFYGRNEK